MRAGTGIMVAGALVSAGCLGNPLAGLGGIATTTGTVSGSCASADGAGDPAASQAQVDGLWRLNCHRRLADLPEARLDPALSAAAQGHADYMSATGQYAHGQSDAGHPGWTGETAQDRATAAGYSLDTGVSQLAEVIGFRSDGADAVFAIDNWINTVYHREPLLVPELQDVGFGEAGIYNVMELVSPWTDPVPDFTIYPARGQSDVPTSFDSDTESPDPIPNAGVVGSPITISVLADGWASDTDPYTLQIDPSRTSIRTTAGTEIPFLILEPGDDPWLVRMVALVPLAPLDPGTTYEVAVALTVNGALWEEGWAFATGSE